MSENVTAAGAAFLASDPPPLLPPPLPLPPNANDTNESQPELSTTTAVFVNGVYDGPNEVDGESVTNIISFLGSDNMEDVEAVNDIQLNPPPL